jgi:hypothetical protein
LYQRIDYDHFISRTLFNRSFEQTKGDRWQFPLLAQYHAKFQRARPFVEAGLTISRITNASGKISDLSSSPSQSKPSSIIYATTTQAGFVAGGGLELGLWRLHIRPEVRYVRLFSTEAGFAQACCGGTATGPTPIVPDPFQTNPNEASFLLGISF